MSFINLDNYQFVRASGPDAIQFLQGQLSCNMQNLSTESTLPGALCNLKGRVVANFQVALVDEDCLLRTTSDMAAAILQTLAKYAVFSKVELSKDESSFQVFGCIGGEASAFLEDKFAVLPEQIGACVSSNLGTLIRLPGSDARFEFWCRDAVVIAEIENQCDTGSNAALWQREDVQAGIIHVDKRLSEEYTPQLLNYDISGVIDFKKGCYTGQEVVARMYYRSKPKQRLFLLASESPVDPADELLQLQGDKTKTAEILSIGASAKGSDEPTLVLAILDTSAVEDNWQFALANQSESFLQIQSLPYTE